MHKSLQPTFTTMQRDLQDLFNELSDQPDQVLNRKAADDQWSIHQVMHHLIVTEDLSLKYLQKKLSFNPELKKAGMMTGFRHLGLKIFIKTPIKFKAPEAVSGENLPEESTFWEVVKLWKTNREEMESFLDNLPDDILDKELFKHAMAGKLTVKSMLKFHKSHFYRHRKQIRRLLEAYHFVV